MTYFTGPWPDGARAAMAFTFDIDVAYAYTRSPAPRPAPPDRAELLARQPRALSGLSRGLYGLQVGLPRIRRFLAEQEIRATFFLPSANLERWPEAFAGLIEEGHEIAAHGHEHEALPDYRDDPAGEAAILEASIASFEAHLGRRPAGYRSPAWDMNRHSPDLLAAAGFAYDSSLFAGEAPYRLSLYPGIDGPGGRMLEFPIDWSLDDAPYFLFFKPPVTMAQFHDPDSVYRIWQAELDGVAEEGGVFTLTCHPSIIGRHHRMAILVRLLAHARARGDLWIAPLEEIARHVEAHWPAGASGTEAGQA